MKRVNVILMGFGNVGQAFCRTVLEKTEFCQRMFGLDIRICSIFRAGSALFSPEFLDLRKILREFTPVSSLKNSSDWKSTLSMHYVMESVESGVLVECTPSNIINGEPGLSHIHQALEGKWNVVTANKGPLVIDFHGLRNKAKKNGVALKFSGATAAALPALDVALYSLAGAEFLKIEGILNGTTNYILTEMRKGINYKKALDEAQNRGIAESDPTLDVEGWDTAVKILLISNAVLGTEFSLGDVKIEGITEISPCLLREGREGGRALKLLGKLLRKGKEFFPEVALTLIDQSHPLFGVDGTNKGICFTTDTMSSVTVIGGKSDPRGTGASLLKDIINIYREYP